MRQPTPPEPTPPPRAALEFDDLDFASPAPLTPPTGGLMTPVPLRSDAGSWLLKASAIGVGAALTALCIGLIHFSPAGPQTERGPATSAPAVMPLPALRASEQAPETIILPAIVIHSHANPGHARPGPIDRRPAVGEAPALDEPELRGDPLDRETMGDAPKGP